MSRPRLALLRPLRLLRSPSPPGPASQCRISGWTASTSRASADTSMLSPSTLSSSSKSTPCLRTRCELR
eukprot:7469193-Alexandrium_andersonii.AAC.1